MPLFAGAPIVDDRTIVSAILLPCHRLLLAALRHCHFRNADRPGDTHKLYGDSYAAPRRGKAMKVAFMYRLTIGAVEKDRQVVRRYLLPQSEKRTTELLAFSMFIRAGGANTAQQYLAAGLVDEMEINLVPTLLGKGERLFDGVGDELHGMELARTVAAPKVTHLKFAKR